MSREKQRARRQSASEAPKKRAPRKRRANDLPNKLKPIKEAPPRSGPAPRRKTPPQSRTTLTVPRAATPGVPPPRPDEETQAVQPQAVQVPAAEPQTAPKQQSSIFSGVSLVWETVGSWADDSSGELERALPPVAGAAEEPEEAEPVYALDSDALDAMLARPKIKYVATCRQEAARARSAQHYAAQDLQSPEPYVAPPAAQGPLLALPLAPGATQSVTPDIRPTAAQSWWCAPAQAIAPTPQSTAPLCGVWPGAPAAQSTAQLCGVWPGVPAVQQTTSWRSGSRAFTPTALHSGTWPATQEHVGARGHSLYRGQMTDRYLAVPTSPATLYSCPQGPVPAALGPTTTPRRRTGIHFCAATPHWDPPLRRGAEHWDPLLRRHAAELNDPPLRALPLQYASSRYVQ